jgi:hypothetical protein
MRQIGASSAAPNRAKGDAMAAQDQFTPEEWKQIAAGPINAGMMIAFAKLQGPIGLAQELKAIYGATVTDVMNSPSELQRAIGAELAQQRESAAQNEADKARARQAAEEAKGDPQAFFLEAIARAVALVQQKTPDEAGTYKAWLLQTAQKTAQAAKEGGFFGFGGTQVTAEETASIERLAAAINAPPAPPAPEPAPAAEPVPAATEPPATPAV